MQDNPIPTTIDRQNQEDAALLSVLICTNNHRPVSEAEIERAMEKDPVDSLRRLHTGGLIHRSHGFVWASKAARSWLTKCGTTRRAAAERYVKGMGVAHRRRHPDNKQQECPRAAETAGGVTQEVSAPAG
jgi:hypothetical protein